MTGKLLLGGAVATGLYFAFRKKQTPVITVTDPNTGTVLSTTGAPVPFELAQDQGNIQDARDLSSRLGCCGNPTKLS